eukprot:2685367-Amphidinium_carterae.1
MTTVAARIKEEIAHGPSQEQTSGTVLRSGSLLKAAEEMGRINEECLKQPRAKQFIVEQVLTCTETVKFAPGKADNSTCRCWSDVRPLVRRRRL